MLVETCAGVHVQQLLLLTVTSQKSEQISMKLLSIKLLVLQHAPVLHSVLQLLVIANVVHRSLILSNLMMEAIHSSETLVLTTATWRHIPQDDILQVKIK
jgi:hypothetical protein